MVIGYGRTQKERERLASMTSKVLTEMETGLDSDRLREIGLVPGDSERSSESPPKRSVERGAAKRGGKSDGSTKEAA